jgi:hypothetical protein
MFSTTIYVITLENENMNAKELIRRWKERQAQILGMLPEAVRIEFQELTVAIRRAEVEFAGGKKPSVVENGKPAQAAPETTENFGQMLEKMSQRVPLEDRKRQVARYLAEKGPSARGEILKGTGIPNGSLSNVLLDQDLFEQGAGNLWILKPNHPGVGST